jgi:hypothetical protein
LEYILARAAEVSIGIDITEAVGLVGSSARPDSRLGLGVRTLGGADREVGGIGLGLERLLARPNMSFAADATVQLPPPLAVGRLLSLPRVKPGLEMRPGPLSPTAAPV